MKPDITSFRTAVAQASNFGLSPAPGMIWEFGWDTRNEAQRQPQSEQPRASTHLSDQ